MSGALLWGVLASWRFLSGGRRGVVLEFEMLCDGAVRKNNLREVLRSRKEICLKYW